jgi:hypothetical protein
MQALALRQHFDYKDNMTFQQRLQPAPALALECSSAIPRRRTPPMFTLQIICKTIEDAERVLAALKHTVEPAICQVVEDASPGSDDRPT